MQRADEATTSADNLQVHESRDPLRSQSRRGAPDKRPTSPSDAASPEDLTLDTSLATRTAELLVNEEKWIDSGQEASDNPGIQSAYRDFARLLRRVLRQSRKLSHLHERTGSLRSRSLEEFEASARNFGFIKESQDSFAKEAETLLGAIESPPLISTDRLRLLKATMCEDVEAQNPKTHMLRQSIVRLQSAESDTKRVEQKLDSTLQMLNILLPKLGILDQVPEADLPESEATSASSLDQRPELPPVVEDYLDKVGDMRNERERLIDLDHEYAEEKTRRQLLSDQGEEFQMSDDEFEAHWLQLFAAAEVSFVEAANKAKVARSACEVLDLDPAVYRRSPWRAPRGVEAFPTPPDPPVLALSPASQASASQDLARTPSESPFFDPIERRGMSDVFSDDPFVSPSSRREREKWSQRDRVEHWIDLQPDLVGYVQDDVQHSGAAEATEKMTALREIDLRQEDLLQVMQRPETRSRSASEASPLEFTANNRVRPDFDELSWRSRSNDSSLPRPASEPMLGALKAESEAQQMYALSGTGLDLLALWKSATDKSKGE